MTVLPIVTPYDGPYQFQLEFGKQQKETRSATWTFSPNLNKLYAQKDAMCPVRFRVDNCIGGCLIIRALPIFVGQEHVHEIVRRCPNHAQALENANVRHREHFVWCEHPSAQYVSSGGPSSAATAAAVRLSVVVPVEQAQADTPWVTYLYSFKCLDYCIGGPNRRAMAMIFTLENQAGDIFGRQSIDLRICACPGRERRTDEGRLETPAVTAFAARDGSVQQSYLSGVGPAAAGATAVLARTGRSEEPREASNAKRRREADVGEDAKDGGKVFSIYLRGRENFLLLRRIRDCMELAELVRPADRAHYMQTRQYSDGLVPMSPWHGGGREREHYVSSTTCDKEPCEELAKRSVDEILKSD